MYSNNNSPLVLMPVRSFKSKILLPHTINNSVIHTRYAVRGELAIRAEQLRQQLEKDPNSLPFKKIINCNIGNPQQLDQKPITLFREIMALIEFPQLMDEGNIEHSKHLFNPDAITRAKKILSAIEKYGPYSHSKGLAYVREKIASFIEKRDGYPADAENIFLTNGASPAVQSILQLIIQNPQVGVMIPIPQYPLYSATLTLLNGTTVPYFLEECNGWSLEVKEIKRALEEARKNAVDVRALCIINPGNPTGNCIEEEELVQILKLCKEERLVLLSDEVYQENVYIDKKFVSAKKALKSLGDDYKDFELFSFHSISKGVLGECGRRGGYVECVGIHDMILEEIYKMASLNLCASISGQIMLSLMVDPPIPGDLSYALYKKETEEIFESLKRRASIITSTLNKLPNISCQEAEGALYIFPKIDLPKKAIEAAEKAGKRPDDFYSLALLEETGVCVVPGSGFGQVDGTFHVRYAFLPKEDAFPEFLQSIENFHRNFIKKYE